MLPNGPYNPQENEKEMLAYWLDNKMYKPEYSPTEKRVLSTEEMKQDIREAWALICPPPNAYARPHIGNISGYAYQDAMARYARMKGKKVLVLPGKDHAGLEGEGVFVREVLEKQNRFKFDMKREDFYAEMMEFFMKNIDIARKDEREIGLSADFDRDTFTLDPDIVETVLNTFVEMYKDGRIYKGVRIVNWDPKARTAVADNQIEYKDSVTPFYYFKYAIPAVDRKVWRLNFYKSSILEAIKAGTKTTETRVLNPEEPHRYFGEMKSGDLLECLDKNTGEIVTKLIKEVRVYSNVQDFLDKEDFSKIYVSEPSPKNVDDLIKSYNQLKEGYGDKLAKDGVVSIDMEEYLGDPEPKAIELKNRFQGKDTLWKVQESSEEKSYILGESHNGTKILGVGYDKVPAGNEVNGVVVGIQMRLDNEFRLVVRGIDFEGDINEEIKKTNLEMFKEVAGAHIIKFDEYPEDRFYTNGFILGTVRPETKFGDTALAVNLSDERYAEFVGKKIKVQTLNGIVELNIISDYAVEKDFGTGVVKVTPAHSPQDWEIAQRHPEECLPAKQVIGYDLKLNHLCGKYAGLNIKQAREAMRDDLKREGLLVQVDETYQNRIQIAERTKAPIEPLLSSQWYLKYDGLKEAAIDMVKTGEVKIHPDNMVSKFNHWMNNLRDWAISRSLWWGYRLPVWYAGPISEEIDENGQVVEKIKINTKTSSSVKIRKASVEDAKAMCEIDVNGWMQNFIDEERGITKEVLENKYGKRLDAEKVQEFEEMILDENKVFFVAEIEGGVVGWVNLENLKMKEEINWLNIYVERNHQKQGIGRMLMERVLEEFGELEIHIATPEKAKISDFYAKFGFLEYPVEGRKEGGLYMIQMKRLPSQYGNWVNLEYDNPDHLRVQKESPGENWIQDENVLDTWFSSGQWVYATLEKYKLMDTFFPTDVLVSASDILENWDSRMMMFTYFKHKNIPFKNLYLTGLVLGKDGQKMSKSRGNIADVDQIKANYGTDALRLAYFYQNSAGGSYVISDDKLKNFKNFNNKLWNASRFVLMNSSETLNSNIEAPKDRELKLELSKRIFEQITNLKDKITKNMDSYEFGYATESLYEEFWHTFCDVDIEESKKYLNTLTDRETGKVISEPNPEEKAEMQQVLIYTLKEYLKMLHPFIPFITERIWREVPKVEGDHESLMYSKY